MKKKISAYAKATERLNREVERATAQVEKLSKLYANLPKK